jgi:iron complex transport system permease protein
MESLNKISPTGLCACALIVLILITFVSATFGQVTLSYGEVWRGLIGWADVSTNIIVQELRLPRIIMAALCGAVLGYSGALLQGLLRNPLADPGVIGVSASASLGAVIVIYFGLGGVFSFAVPLGAIIGALTATVILTIVASRDTSILTLILAGVGISSLATAGISLVMNFAPHSMTLQEMILWMMGSLENVTFSDVSLTLPFIAFGAVLVVGAGRNLDALSLGEDTAKTLGVNLKRLRLRVVVGVALAVGACVAVCGAIGFVGLIVPHFVRALVGYEPSKILLPSALVGAIILMAADILTRLPIGVGQLRLGVVMGVLGAPVFLFIIFRTRSSMR